MNSLTANAHALLNIRGSYVLAQPDDILALVLERNHVLSFRRSWIHDLGQTADLEGRILLHHLLVRLNIPLGWHRKSGVRLFDALKVDNFLVKVLDLSLNLLQRLRVRSLTIPLEEVDVTLRQGHSLVVLHDIVRVFLVIVSGSLLSRVDLLLRLFLLLLLRHSSNTSQ